MPGCTVPCCSNSTQKGFKLFHFPADVERCALWVKNCGREEGWEPTRHTCICEVHFEESQFELHRADGLRKLKPYAVPTLFSEPSPNFYKRIKKGNSEHEGTNWKPGFQMNSSKRKNDKNATTVSFGVVPIVSKNAQKPDLEKNVEKSKSGKGDRIASTVSSVAYTVQNTQSNIHVPACKEVRIVLSKEEVRNYASLIQDSSNNVSRVSNSRDKGTNWKPGFQKSSSNRKDDKSATILSLDDAPSVSEKPELEKNVEKKRSGKSSRSVSTDVSSVSYTVHKSQSNNQVPVCKEVRIVLSKEEVKKYASSLIQDSSKNVRRVSDSRNKAREESPSSSEENTCFICNSRNQNIVPNNARTETSKTQLKQKLVQLVSVEFDLLVKDIGTICINCAQILNCIDYIENCYSTLSKGILNHIKQKFRLQPTEHINLELYMKSLKNLTAAYPWRDVDECCLSQKRKENASVTSEMQLSHQSDKSLEVADQFSENKDADHIEDDDGITVLKIVETVEKTFKCEICSYETKYKAFMKFHLNQHFKGYYSCDFCRTPVAYDPSPAKERQTPNASYKIRKDFECVSDRLSVIPPPQVSKAQIDYQQHTSDNLGKRNVEKSRKRKSNTQASHKNVKQTNISHRR